MFDSDATSARNASCKDGGRDNATVCNFLLSDLEFDAIRVVTVGFRCRQASRSLIGRVAIGNCA